MNELHGRPDLVAGAFDSVVIDGQPIIREGVFVKPAPPRVFSRESFIEEYTDVYPSDETRAKLSQSLSLVAYYTRERELVERGAAEYADCVIHALRRYWPHDWEAIVAGVRHNVERGRDSIGNYFVPLRGEE